MWSISARVCHLGLPFRSGFVTEAQRRVEPSFSRLFYCSLNSYWRIQVRPVNTLHRLEVRTPLPNNPQARTKPLKSRCLVHYYPLEIYFHSCFSSISNMTVKLMRTECLKISLLNRLCSTGSWYELRWEDQVWLLVGLCYLRAGLGLFSIYIWLLYLTRVLWDDEDTISRVN